MSRKSNSFWAPSPYGYGATQLIKKSSSNSSDDNFAYEKTKGSRIGKKSVNFVFFLCSNSKEISHSIVRKF